MIDTVYINIVARSMRIALMLSKKSDMKPYAECNPSLIQVHQKKAAQHAADGQDGWCSLAFSRAVVWPGANGQPSALQQVTQTCKAAA